MLSITTLPTVQYNKVCILVAAWYPRYFLHTSYIYTNSLGRGTVITFRVK